MILRYKLDDIGDQIYNNLLASTLRTDHMYVSINGIINKNGELAVIDIVEAVGKLILLPYLSTNCPPSNSNELNRSSKNF